MVLNVKEAMYKLVMLELKFISSGRQMLGHYASDTLEMRKLRKFITQLSIGTSNVLTIVCYRFSLIEYLMSVEI